jgi:hypothetical protein
MLGLNVIRGNVNVWGIAVVWGNVVQGHPATYKQAMVNAVTER